MKVINASEFKAKCLGLLDEVASTGQPLTVLKHGKPVAEVHPPMTTNAAYPQLGLLGTVDVCGDIISPAIPSETWEVEGRDP